MENKWIEIVREANNKLMEAMEEQNGMTLEQVVECNKASELLLDILLKANK